VIAPLDNPHLMIASKFILGEFKSKKLSHGAMGKIIG